MLGKWMRRLAFGAWALIAGCGGDEPFEPGTGGIMGSVSNAFGGDVLPGVTVAVAGKSAQSDAVGQFELTGIPAGPQSLHATKDGYREHSGSVTVIAGETRVIDIPLVLVAGPVGLSAQSGNESGQVHLGWVASAGAESYTLYWSTAPGVTPESGTRISNLQGTSYDHSGLSPGTAYYYALTAVHEGAEGPLSAEVSATAANGISLRIRDPVPGFVADQDVQAMVEVSSVYQLVSVTASIEGQATPLEFLTFPDRWYRRISLTGVPSHRLHTVLFTATDIRGTVGTASQSFEHNRRAVVTIESPLPGTVVQSQVRLRVTCVDDVPSGCANLKIGAATGDPSPISQDIADGVTSFDQDMSLSIFDGRTVGINAQGTDDLGRLSFAGVTVHVDLSPALVKVAEVTGVGTLLDASADRLLVIDTISHRDVYTSTLRIQDRATGQASTILTRKFLTVQGAHLTPHGAVFQANEDESNFTHLYEWRDNTLLDLGIPVGVAIEPPFLAWGVFNGSMFRRNLESGATITVPGVEGSTLSDVGPNGDVVYLSPAGEIKRFRGGVATTIADPHPNPALANASPQTDGTNVVFVNGEFAQSIHPRFSVVALTESGRETLVSLQEWPGMIPEQSYRLNGGWIAFARPASGGAAQVWARDPAGTLTQISFFSGVSVLEELASNGRVVFSNPAGSPVRRRYLWTPGGSAIEISSGMGRPLFIDGQLHLLIGNAVLRVN